MICINKRCAAEIPDGAKFCPWCGKKQEIKQRRRVHPNGAGTVYKRPNGTWIADRTLGYELIPPPEGAPPGTMPRKRRISVTKSGFKTRSAALAYLPNLTADLKRERQGKATAPGLRKGAQITLKELFDLWLPTHQAGKSTINNYKAGFKVFAELWDVPMADITVDDLQDCMDECELGKSTLQKGKAALGLVYKYGIPRDCCPKDRNLALYLRINAEGGVHRPGLSLAELDAVRQLADAGDHDARLVVCHCYLGFRPSALLALRRSDYIDAERAFVGGIKTAAGRDRIVTVSPKIQAYIDGLIPAEPEAYVFGDGGAPLSLDKYRERFYAVLAAAGVDNPIDEDGRHRLTPHSCRHTFATLIKAVKAPDVDKLALIGHTSTEMLRYYQDVDFADLRRVTDGL